MDSSHFPFHLSFFSHSHFGPPLSHKLAPTPPLTNILWTPSPMTPFPIISPSLHPNHPFLSYAHHLFSTTIITTDPPTSYTLAQTSKQSQPQQPQNDIIHKPHPPALCPTSIFVTIERMNQRNQASHIPTTPNTNQKNPYLPIQRHKRPCTPSRYCLPMLFHPFVSQSMNSS